MVHALAKTLDRAIGASHETSSVSEHTRILRHRIKRTHELHMIRYLINYVVKTAWLFGYREWGRRHRVELEELPLHDSKALLCLHVL